MQVYCTIVTTDSHIQMTFNYGHSIMLGPGGLTLITVTNNEQMYNNILGLP